MLRQHLQALAVASASSTDNLLVGISLGICFPMKTLDPIILFGTATCNAVGACVMTLVGETIQDGLGSKTTPNALASMAFACFAFQEWGEWRKARQEKENKADEKKWYPSSVSTSPTWWKLALPMTLNNLAGGVACGVLGCVSPLAASSYVWLVSVGFMWVGWFLGRSLQQVLTSNGSIEGVLPWVSIFLYVLLSAQALREAMEA